AALRRSLSPAEAARRARSGDAQPHHCEVAFTPQAGPIHLHMVNARVTSRAQVAESRRPVAYSRGGAVWMLGQAGAARAVSGDIQLADLPGLFRHRHGASLCALLLVAPEEDQFDDRLVPFLRGVEPSVRDPPVDLDRGRLVGRAVDGSGETGANAQA